MINNRRARSSSSVRQSAVLYALALAALVASSACQPGGSSSNSEARGVIIINAPVAGEVRRVLVSEGIKVNEGTPIVEIAVQDETQAPTPAPGENAQTRAVRSFKAADAEIEAARAEAVRHEAEVQRLTPLVASGDASPAQLEGERALYERAQQRLQQAQDSKRRAESGLLAARQPGQNQGSTATTTAPAPRQQIVTANATSAGTVSAIAARVGEKVKSGQPLATIRAGSN